MGPRPGLRSTPAPPLAASTAAPYSAGPSKLRRIAIWALPTCSWRNRRAWRVGVQRISEKLEAVKNIAVLNIVADADRSGYRPSSAVGPG